MDAIIKQCLRNAGLVLCNDGERITATNPRGDILILVDIVGGVQLDISVYTHLNGSLNEYIPITSSDELDLLLHEASVLLNKMFHGTQHDPSNISHYLHKDGWVLTKGSMNFMTDLETNKRCLCEPELTDKIVVCINDGHLQFAVVDDEAHCESLGVDEVIDLVETTNQL